MIRKLLIANRGEIACRIASTARGMGMSTVAVCSDVDRGAMHVAACDQLVNLGGAAAGRSVLVHAAAGGVARWPYTSPSIWA